MRLAADHLVKSRHGIWYFRWVVPGPVRKRHPSLPKELKRSTKTADIRQARAIARQLHHRFQLLYVRPSDMPLPEGLIRSFEIELDPATGAVRKVVAAPEEWQAAHQAMQDIARQMNEHIHHHAKTLVQAQPAPLATPPSANDVPTISQAFEDFSKLQRASAEWSDETLRYTHTPTIKLFRELVGEARPHTGTDDSEQWDLTLDRLDKERIDRFLDEFWRFPARQGRRSSLTARELMEQGGTPQSRANVFKRLGHVRLFIEYCVQKGWVQPQVLQAIDVVLSKDTKRNRLKAAAQRPGFDGSYVDGYVSFNNDELAALFGKAFKTHVARRADRYWIPLLGLYSGLRVSEASQLQTGDFIIVDGVACIEVKTHEHQGSETGKTRVKTGAAIRKVPIHPRLVELGLLAYVEARRRDQQLWLWDGLLWTQKDGFGKYPSRDFNKLAKVAKVYQHRRKVFHSLRSNFSQALERVEMPTSLADRIIGHHAKSVREVNYGRTDNGQAFPARLIHDKLALIAFPFQLPPWESFVPSPRRPPKR